MASILGGLLSKVAGRARPAKVAPTQTAGVPGFAHYGGYVVSPERRPEVQGLQKWQTYADLATNFSIVAAGTRHFLGLIARTEWSVEPAKDIGGEDSSDAAKEAAEFFEAVMHDMTTPWAKVARRASMYRFNGFGIQEWTAKRIQTGDFAGRVGLLQIVPRPCHTITRWELDPESGDIRGMWQTHPNRGTELFLPRGKVLYMVDDSLTDAPEGLGLFHHLVETAERLREYVALESTGYQRDLRGIPVGRAPLSAIERDVGSGRITREFADGLIRGLEDLVRMQAKAKDTGIILDSQPYESQSDTGVNVSPVQQWAIDTITGNPTGLGEMANSINRLNREMARVLGAEQLMLGEGAGTRSLSEDKTSSFFLQVEGTLADVAEGMEKDVRDPVWTLNGLPEELKPTLRYEAVQFKDVAKITAALRDMATAGAVLSADDPAINDVRELLGVSDAPEIDPEVLAGMQRMAAGLPDPNAPDPQEETPGKPGEDEEDE